MSTNYTLYPSSTTASSSSTTTGSAIGAAYVVGSLDSAALSPNGGVIGSNSLYFQSATTTYPGLVNSASQTFAGTKSFLNAAVFGDAGAEGTSVTFQGASYACQVKVSDISDASPAEFIIHKHSTTLPTVLGMMRSHSTGSGHGAVLVGDILSQIYGAGWVGGSTGYTTGTLIESVVDSGTVSSTSLPAKFNFYTVPNSSISPALAMTLDSNQNATFYGQVTAITSIGSKSIVVGSVSMTSSTGGQSYSVTWPGAQGGATSFPGNDGGGKLSWINATSSQTASTLVYRDVNGNANANAFVENLTTCTSSASDLTLTISSPMKIYVTGTAAQNIILPDARTLPTGWKVKVLNRSSYAYSGTVIKYNGGTIAQTMPNNSDTILELADNTTAIGSWTNSTAILGPVLRYDDITNLTIYPQVSANALTLNVRDYTGSFNPTATGPFRVSFINAADTITGGLHNEYWDSAVSLTVPAGATLGTVSGVASYLYVYLIDNGQVMEVAVSGKGDWDESLVQSSTTISSGATSGSILYSATGRSNKAIRLVGRILVTEATAGQWATAPANSYGLIDVNMKKALYTKSGDFLVGSSNGAPSVLSVGTNSWVMTADSTKPLGVAWAPMPSTTGSVTFTSSTGGNSYSLVLPGTLGSGSSFLANDGNGHLSFSSQASYYAYYSGPSMTGSLTSSFNNVIFNAKQSDDYGRYVGDTYTVAANGLYSLAVGVATTGTFALNGQQVVQISINGSATFQESSQTFSTTTNYLSSDLTIPAFRLNANDTVTVQVFTSAAGAAWAPSGSENFFIVAKIANS